MEIKQLLKEHVLEVVFKKANGEQRTMICTTKPELVMIDTFSSKPGPEHLCTVWDLEFEGWRSFKIDSVINYRILEDENA